MAKPEVTVGIDVGTSSVKAVAADADGNVVARTRIGHGFAVPSPMRFEHDARVAWLDGPRAAFRELRELAPRAVSVAAMVPSLCAVDVDGVPCTPGLLYGDERGDTGSTGSPAESGELAAFLGWIAHEAPAARGYWPAQAVANFGLCGDGVISTTTAATATPLFDWTGWDAALVARAGARVEQMPRIEVSGRAVGDVVDVPGCVLEAGTIDALGEQVVAGADRDGDVLVICGTTLIVWIVVSEPREVPGCFTVPHTVAGKFLVGGPSNAGGLFLDWVRRLVEPGTDPDIGSDTAHPDAVPIWLPYPRGERVPLHDRARRAVLLDLDLTHDAAAVRRGAYEAAGFVVRRMVDAAGVTPQRVIATGGGTRDERWIQALADTTGISVDVAAVVEGGALGAAFLARLAAGLETNLADGARWARRDRTVDPRHAWIEPTAARYARFSELGR
ncbi:MAG TPA: FGGY-family carbohydrate kinase [Acidimicrobiia bacterium]|nr:FGGY-family carbohydrate kinase [Acidimicrobiia bacterium]